MVLIFNNNLITIFIWIVTDFLTQQPSFHMVICLVDLACGICVKISKFWKKLNPKCMVHSGFDNFETFIDDFVTEVTDDSLFVFPFIELL